MKLHYANYRWIIDKSYDWKKEFIKSIEIDLNFVDELLNGKGKKMYPNDDLQTIASKHLNEARKNLLELKFDEITYEDCGGYIT